jgi:L-alanine-DL-glutamate epimerase-like enolase superfamily enzyme
MKITGISTRLIEVDASARYKDGVIPPGRPESWLYPLLTVHTDEGIEGLSMAYGPHGDGAALAEVLHAAYRPEIMGEDPLDTKSSGRNFGESSDTSTTSAIRCSG